MAETAPKDNSLTFSQMQEDHRNHLQWFKLAALLHPNHWQLFTEYARNPSVCGYEFWVRTRHYSNVDRKFNYWTVTSGGFMIVDMKNPPDNPTAGKLDVTGLMDFQQLIPDSEQVNNWWVQINREWEILGFTFVHHDFPDGLSAIKKLH